MGHRVGYVLSEKVAKDMGRLSTELEVSAFFDYFISILCTLFNKIERYLI